MTITKAEGLAYIAGVMDSDGYIGITKNKGRGNNTLFDTKIIINQTQTEAIDFVREIFGGSYAVMKPGKIEWKAIHRWHIQDRRSIKIFLKAILPHLRIKRKQAEMVIEYCDIREEAIRNNGGATKNTYSGIEEVIYENVRKLNQTGTKKVIE